MLWFFTDCDIPRATTGGILTVLKQFLTHLHIDKRLVFSDCHFLDFNFTRFFSFCLVLCIALMSQMFTNVS